MNEQYKICIQTEHQNRLAIEIRDLFSCIICQLSTTKWTQAVILAQSNAILAAAALMDFRCVQYYRVLDKQWDSGNANQKIMTL